MQENSNNSNNNNSFDLMKKSSTILDLLNHEVCTTIGADRTLKRLERVLLQPELLNTLSFEQIMQYYDKVLRRQKDGREFIIDFYRVTSKSQDIQSALKQYTMMGEKKDQVIDGEVVSSESERDIRNRFLSQLDEMFRAQDREAQKHEG